MVDRVEISSPVTTSERPAAAPASQTAETNNTESRPTWLPENFKTPEDFAKSANDTRAELTRVQQELAQLKKGTEKKPEETSPSAKDDKAKAEGEKVEEVTKALESKGLDVNAMSQRFWQTGEVATADLDALEAAGIPRDAVLDYANMQKDRQTQTTNALMEHVGGKDQFDAIKAWAVNGVDPELASAYETARNSGNVTLMKQALTSLREAFVKENGQNPNVVVQGGAPATSGSAYRSHAEMIKDMSDPRYRTDEAYRKDVEGKIARSSIF